MRYCCTRFQLSPICRDCSSASAREWERMYLPMAVLASMGSVALTTSPPSASTSSRWLRACCRLRPKRS